MSAKGLDCNAWHPDVQTLRDAARFLACGLVIVCLLLIGWMAIAPHHVRGWLIDTLAPIGALVMGAMT